jgi:hypothetical protein
MWHSTRLPALALLALFHLPAAAQEAGGVVLDPQVLASANVPVLTPPGFPFNHTGSGISPNGPPNVGSAANRSATNQQLISQIRGDGGFLEGFQNGQPLAASRQPAQAPEVPIVINNTPYFFNSQGGPVSVDFGSGNVVQQQVGPQATGQGQAVNFAAAAGANAAAGTGTGGAGTGRHHGRGSGANVTNGGGNTVIAGTNASVQQQVLTIAGPVRSPVTQQQGGH